MPEFTNTEKAIKDLLAQYALATDKQYREWMLQISQKVQEELSVLEVDFEKEEEPMKKNCMK